MSDAAPAAVPSRPDRTAILGLVLMVAVVGFCLWAGYSSPSTSRPAQPSPRRPLAQDVLRVVDVTPLWVILETIPAEGDTPIRAWMPRPDFERRYIEPLWWAILPGNRPTAKAQP